MSGPPPCLTCRERLPHVRGCCPRCYTRNKHEVASGEATWEELQAKGLVLPPRPLGEGWRRWSLGTGE